MATTKLFNQLISELGDNVTSVRITKVEATLAYICGCQVDSEGVSFLDDEIIIEVDDLSIIEETEVIIFDDGDILTI